MFTDLAVEQARRGWEVHVLTSNRLWRDPHARLPAEELWNGVHIHRVFRPPWDQARPVQRLANSGWMTAAWAARTLALGRFDAMVVGSDPAFAALVALGWRAAQPQRRHRALVLRRLPRSHRGRRREPGRHRARPGGPTADGHGLSALRRHRRHRPAHARAIGHLRQQAPARRRSAPGPWPRPPRPAPVDAAARAALFPRARLALLYSGTMGRAHAFEPFLRLARACRARSGDAVSHRLRRPRQSRRRAPSRRHARGHQRRARPVRRRGHLGRRAWPPPTCTSSACDPNGAAWWFRRSSSPRWPSVGR